MSERPTERLPPDAIVPNRDILLDISQRLSVLSAAILDPDSSLNRRLELTEKEAVRRHIEQMAVLKRATDEVLEVRKRVDDLEEDSIDHETRIRAIQLEMRGGAEVQ